MQVGAAGRVRVYSLAPSTLTGKSSRCKGVGARGCCWEGKSGW